MRRAHAAQRAAATELVALVLDKMRQERFDVFMTGDRNLQFQQHLPATGVAVVVLRARSTRLAETLPLMSPLLALVPNVKPGTVTFLPGS